EPQRIVAVHGADVANRRDVERAQQPTEQAARVDDQSAAFVAPTATLSSAARTETIVWTRGGLENNQRTMRLRCEMPYHGTLSSCGWSRLAASICASARRLGATRLAKKRIASSGDRDQARPGKAWMRRFDH